ncbi:MAG: PstS family phosphate ABC transporter substrate-binding protein [Planctomycetaceae bacterium]|nr:PstS family phosphate ABC transporter substrate-binding protein [Planctomycetales bacterium]MCB9923906.1 PstS family phosphate ABC transporter substrate-binding protein [Planctomycetaceae bacterium]
MKSRWSWWLIAVMVAFGTGCAGSSDVTEISDLSELNTTSSSDSIEESGVSELTGQIRIDGSSTVYPISEAAANRFKKEFPKVNVTVGTSGTGGGFKVFTKGETDISDASRPIKKAEFDQCKESGVEFVEIPVAYDGLTIVVNPANTWVNQLSVEQLKKIFGEKGAAKNWSDVNPEWPAEAIKIYAPGTDSGTFDYFKEVVADEDSSLRSDMSVSEDDNVLVTGVSGEKNAIGFFGAAYYFENAGSLKAVPIVNPATGEAVLPSPDTIESGVYAPFSRPLFIYVNIASLKRPEMKKFASFYLEHAAELAVQVGYVGLPTSIYELAGTHLNERLTGTHFVDAAGEKRSGALPELYTTENLTK